MTKARARAPRRQKRLVDVRGEWVAERRLLANARHCDWLRSPLRRGRIIEVEDASSGGAPLQPPRCRQGDTCTRIASVRCRCAAPSQMSALTVCLGESGGVAARQPREIRVGRDGGLACGPAEAVPLHVAKVAEALRRGAHRLWRKRVGRGRAAKAHAGHVDLQRPCRDRRWRAQRMSLPSRWTRERGASWRRAAPDGATPRLLTQLVGAPGCGSGEGRERRRIAAWAQRRRRLDLALVLGVAETAAVRICGTALERHGRGRVPQRRRACRDGIGTQRRVPAAAAAAAAALGGVLRRAAVRGGGLLAQRPCAGYGAGRRLARGHDRPAAARWQRGATGRCRRGRRVRGVRAARMRHRRAAEAQLWVLEHAARGASEGSRSAE